MTIPEILAEREEMLALLKDLEWSGTEVECGLDPDDDQHLEVCPSCRGERTGGHANACRLAALLKPDARTVPK